MKWNAVTQEAYHVNSDLVTLSNLDVNGLKEKVYHCPNKRIRICTHQNTDDLLHEMIIVATKESYIRPHKHLENTISYHMIEGELDIVIFDDHGEIIEIIPMGDFKSGKNFYYRLSKTMFYAPVLKTDLAVFHETIRGPYKKENTVWAAWSPESDDSSVTIFRQNLEEKVKQGSKDDKKTAG